MLAPDYAEPVLGWRSWVATWIDGDLLLCSPVYPTVWPIADVLEAECKSNSRSMWRRRDPRAEHAVPAEGCQCGLYAVNSPKRATSYLKGQGVAAIPGEVAEMVVGRVSLWGRVVECDNGWRAQYAYPAEIFVCSRTPGAARSFFGQRIRDDPVDVETIVELVGRYGVPVRAVPGGSVDDVAAAFSN